MEADRQKRSTELLSRGKKLLRQSRDLLQQLERLLSEQHDDNGTAA